MAYTDGSCPNNRTAGPDNPAGWGFAASVSPLRSQLPIDGSWLCSHGMVKTTPLHEYALVPLDGCSNNTVEMRATIELFDYILYFSQFPFGSEVDIFMNSSYVIRSLQGDQLPSTHHQQVEFAQQYHTALRAIHKVTLHKVSSHTRIPGNELADSLTKRGATTYGSLGRFSPPRALLLSPPQLGYNSDIWLSNPHRNNQTFFAARF